MTTLDDGPPPIRLFPLFLKFLRFGCLAFGGPVAQIAMLRQTLVEEERWLSGPRFNRLLAVMQILPGPEAHELCVHMGMMARGRIGGRVHSFKTDGGVTLELGAAVLMGLQGGNPLATLCRKHGLAMHRLQHACPLHDADGAL